MFDFSTDSPVELRSEADQHYIKESLLSRSQCTYQASSPDEVYIYFIFIDILEFYNFKKLLYICHRLH